MGTKERPTTQGRHTYALFSNQGSKHKPVLILLVDEKGFVMPIAVWEDKYAKDPEQTHKCVLNVGKKYVQEVKTGLTHLSRLKVRNVMIKQYIFKQYNTEKTEAQLLDSSAFVFLEDGQRNERAGEPKIRNERREPLPSKAKVEREVAATGLLPTKKACGSSCASPLRVEGLKG